MDLFLEEKKENEEIFKRTLPPWVKTPGNLTNIKAEDIPVDLIIESAFELLSKSFKNYKTRVFQIQMSKNILKNLVEDKTTVLEAGTGIGKSFAYLIAAFAYSYLTGERVIISTETKGLQLQLYEKDLPILAEALFIKKEYELALGSNNYLCKLRYEETFQTGKFTGLINKTMQKSFHGWAANVLNDENKHGHVYELDKNYPADFWRMVSRDSDGCPGGKCVFFSKCNYYRAKKIWGRARIIVTNHHLTLFNLLNERKTLPTYEACILDEAHGFIKTGFDIFSLSFSNHYLSDQKKIIQRFLKENSNISEKTENGVSDLLKSTEKKWDLFFSNWETSLNLNFADNETRIIDGKNKVDSKELIENINSIRTYCSEAKEETEDSLALNGLNSITKSLGQAVLFLERFQKMDNENNVYWADKKTNSFLLKTCRLMLGDELYELMPETKVWLSATLGYWPYSYLPNSSREIIQKGYFNHFLNEAMPESEKENLNMQLYASPFDYEKNCMLYVPGEVQEPQWNASDFEKRKYEDSLYKEIKQLLKLSNGGALILFTSHYMLNVITEKLQENTDFQIFSQADWGAEKALSLFRENPDSVLLGANSYWQGIDITGFHLRMLIIVKLMFTPPDDPLFKAKCDRLEAQNKKPFFELSLPKAGIMLKQAFGRLIRTETDTGVTAILDGRILKKSYGKTLLANLPAVEMVTNFQTLSSKVREKKIYK
ncbi:MAG: ATP-dependent DNA helicase [Spirochaetia bacterium]|nr:ATP-dependent DNA helicase [Spirochaetia bacterium]